ncbi:MAG: translation initiation factor IF-2 [Leptospirales bacterium]|nr:translation initiation factor IF-2 [Leptospirales bacterium]
MKAIDIANRNHILIGDVEEVCKELGISFEIDKEISENEVFLIEKKIEVIKNKRIKTEKNKKIKLKRKVNIPKEAPKESEVASAPVSTSASVSAPVTASPPKVDKPTQAFRKKPDASKPSSQKPVSSSHKGAKRPFRRDDKKPGGPNEQRDQRNRPPRDNRRPTGPSSAGAAPSSDNKFGASGSSSGTPMGIDEFKKRKKVKDKDKDKDKDKEKEAKYKKNKIEEKSLELRKKQSLQQKRENTPPGEINITDTITVGELAKKLNIKAGDVIGKLIKMGEMVTINQTIDADTAILLAAEYGSDVKVVSLYDETVIKQEEEDKPEDRVWRSPVVTVMGHVDHGKTKLLDTIRETKVADSEHGGITQHIGAYTVSINGKNITFLDTPGHAAFTTMRARGAQVTDIVILVVAANDSVMPQTIEAIDHAKAADVPIIVAINKIDLEDSNLDKVRNDLSVYGLISEEWGGTTLFAYISAKKNINIDGLLELVLIQAEMLELKENPKLMAKGVVLESKLDSGRGAVSTILIKRGTLRTGDPFVVGHYSGKVRAMFDDRGVEITEAGPSRPVEILGISGVPSAGDPFECVDSEKIAKQISQKRLEYLRIESAKKVRKVTLESLNDMISEGAVKELCIIVKADVDGSAQALTESLRKLSTGEVKVNVIHSGAGGINESDVMLASASNAIIIGYHVRPTGKVSDIADKERVSIKFYNIIFEATDAVKSALEGMLSPVIKEEIMGFGEVRQTFKISKLGTIAGAILESGKVRRKSRIRIIRDGVVVFDGEIKSLKRFKDDAGEIVAGQEFGFGLQNFNDIKDGDNFEAYELIQIAKTLS